jgi:hypothetical protein
MYSNTNYYNGDEYNTGPNQPYVGFVKKSILM